MTVRHVVNLFEETPTPVSTTERSERGCLNNQATEVVKELKEGRSYTFRFKCGGRGAPLHRVMIEPNGNIIFIDHMGETSDILALLGQNEGPTCRRLAVAIGGVAKVVEDFPPWVDGPHGQTEKDKAEGRRNAATKYLIYDFKAPLYGYGPYWFKQLLIHLAWRGIPLRVYNPHITPPPSDPKPGKRRVAPRRPHGPGPVDQLNGGGAEDPAATTGSAARIQSQSIGTTIQE